MAELSFGGGGGGIESLVTTHTVDVMTAFLDAAGAQSTALATTADQTVIVQMPLLLRSVKWGTLSVGGGTHTLEIVGTGVVGTVAEAGGYADFTGLSVPITAGTYTFRLNKPSSSKFLHYVTSLSLGPRGVPVSRSLDHLVVANMAGGSTYLSKLAISYEA